MILKTFGYLADAWIVGTYLLMASGRARKMAFHWANAVGCIPLIALEAMAGLWAPLLLSAAFGVIGAFGVIHDR